MMILRRGGLSKKAGRRGDFCIHARGDSSDVLVIMVETVVAGGGRVLLVIGVVVKESRQ